MKYGKRTRPVANDPATEYERSWTWVKVSRSFRNLNPVCQAIEDGRRCLSKAELVHHLVSPAVNFELRAFWPNLVALCARHHSKECGDAGKFDYADTKLLVAENGSEWFVHAPRVQKMTMSTPNMPTEAKMAELLADVQSVDPDELLANLKAVS